MKRKLILAIFFLCAIFQTGCKIAEDPIILKDNKTKISKNRFDYNVDKVVLSSSYQNLKPNVSVAKSDKNSKIIASLGLMKSSGIEIDKVEKNEKDIDIYVKNISKGVLDKFVTPQVSISLDGIKQGKLEDFNFNIINTNYENILLNIEISDILKKIENTYKVKASIYPEINLLEEENTLLWDIDYKRIFNNEFNTSPIIDLNVKVDAKTGYLLDVEKTNISSFIDSGQVLDHSNPEYILYKKSETFDDNIKETLWIYNTSSEEKEKLYISSLPICSAKINSNNSFVYILEKDENNSILYLLDTKDNKSYKVMLKDNMFVNSVAWKDDNTLLLIENVDGITNIYEHDIHTNDFTYSKSFNYPISSIRIKNDKYLFTYSNKKTLESLIHIYDLNSDSDYKLNGIKPKFLNTNKIGYIHTHENKDSSEFLIFNLDDYTVYDKVELNISNFTPVDDNTLILLEKNNVESSYTVYIYDIENKSYEKIQKATTDNIWFNKSNELLYMNLRFPDSKDDSSLILYLKDVN